jgi:hypothetical protein
MHTSACWNGSAETELEEEPAKACGCGWVILAEEECT